MIDILGKALIDFYHGRATEPIITETNISEADELPLDYLCRNYNDMPAIEQHALSLCRGKILDVGCCAGSHSLHLQENGLQVTAIDISPGAIEVAKARGVHNATVQDVIKLNNEQFDTIIILMNGTGIFETLEKAPQYLQHLKTLLAPEGQILIDSTDIQYMYDAEDNGAIWVPADRYYGELTFTMAYQGEKSEEFDWLYLDQQRLKKICLENQLQCEIVKQGTNFDYLAKLTFA